MNGLMLVCFSVFSWVCSMGLLGVVNGSLLIIIMFSVLLVIFMFF